MYAALLIPLVLAAATAAAAVAIPDPRLRSLAAGAGSAAMSAAGVVAGALALAGAEGGVALPTALGIPVTFAPDRTGGLFLVIVSAVGLLVSISGAAGGHGPAASRTGWVAFVAFLLGMQLVPAASDVAGFLLAWETMAIGSLVLVLAEHAQRATVGSAAIWYAVMSQLSFALILASLGTLAAEAGGTSFAALARVDPGSAAATWAFLLGVVGFGIKMGLVPVHVWLPRAHPEAPSHVSAAMSAAMVKLGVLGVLLLVVRLLPGGPAWWGVVLVVLGGASAAYGILRAAVTSDLKVLLAYSTTENMGLIALAIGAALLLDGPASSAALLAALLLAVSHAAFKVTLFLGAGSILHATGERDLDLLGGLARRMPWTAAAFGVAALGAAALPVSSGFVSEWVLLQSLVHGTRYAEDSTSLIAAIAIPPAVGVVALTAGLAVLTFVKAYGIAFLARPRSAAAAEAREPSLLERVPLLLGAGLVVALGLLPGALGAALAPLLPEGADVVRPAGAIGIGLPALKAGLDPILLVALAAACALPVVIASVLLARRLPARTEGAPWGGGGLRIKPSMQYTATSFAEPTMRVFDDVLRPSRDVEVSHAGESRYLVRRVDFDLRLVDVIEHRAYRPVLRLVDRFGVAARGIQNGSIHRYLLYSFAAVVAVLVVVAVISL